ncbi:ATP-dependent sacrificial sulfur transferase LarE [Maridesulfovibrio hydrothermalis]|uniref:NAD/GMP synthase domain-containing protein n=1 Tax=Maridesulfovibrio hydrothermalis AM13 = DSM 14728 TaxID=1121451 RepID=L0R7V5_9BACT|nr:ATP-dependent sacrificial sulfur transferase LarE [Maridesulfovibrio hydrothermalis]CCO22819.1 conserved protein of unknown function [Maridesulfovibrio hydrothermalis AM13 = DSM 14728]
MPITSSCIIQKQYSELLHIFEEYSQAFVAFSGGVDSSLVAKAALDTLGHNAVAVTVRSEFTAQRDLNFARASAREIGITHKVINIQLLKTPQVTVNSASRCYHCKKAIVSSIKGYPVFDGSHAEDSPERPGLQALREAGVISPLALAGFNKLMIIKTARHLNMLSAGQPSNSCLATRVKTGIPLTVEILNYIELVEEIMFDLGAVWCRARTDSHYCHIEYGTFSEFNEFEAKQKILTTIDNSEKLNFKFCRK